MKGVNRSLGKLLFAATMHRYNAVSEGVAKGLGKIAHIASTSRAAKSMIGQNSRYAGMMSKRRPRSTYKPLKRGPLGRFK